MSLLKNEIPHEKALDYLLGGKAHTTVFNEITNNQRKYFILARVWKYDDPGCTYMNKDTIKFYIVYDTHTGKNRYLGKINLDIEPTLYTFEYNDRQPTIKEAREFAWFWKHLTHSSLVYGIHILHLGSCSVCGRPLTDAESLITGIGPICQKRLLDRKNQSI